MTPSTPISKQVVENDFGLKGKCSLSDGFKGALDPQTRFSILQISIFVCYVDDEQQMNIWKFRFKILIVVIASAALFELRIEQLLRLLRCVCLFWIEMRGGDTP